MAHLHCSSATGTGTPASSAVYIAAVGTAADALTCFTGPIKNAVLQQKYKHSQHQMQWHDTGANCFAYLPSDKMLPMEYSTAKLVSWKVVRNISDCRR